LNYLRFLPHRSEVVKYQRKARKWQKREYPLYFEHKWILALREQ
jgi:hypothetical protein